MAEWEVHLLNFDVMNAKSGCTCKFTHTQLLDRLLINYNEIHSLIVTVVWDKLMNMCVVADTVDSYTCITSLSLQNFAGYLSEARSMVELLC